MKNITMIINKARQLLSKKTIFIGISGLVFTLISIITIILIYSHNNTIINSPKVENNTLANLATITPKNTSTSQSTEPTPEEIIPIEKLDVKKNYSTAEAIAMDPESKADTAPAKTVKVKDLPTHENSSISYGIDVSRWQGNIDWKAVKAAGIEFAIIKLGGRSIGDDGALYLDKYYEQNMKNAIANGIKVGVYFFSQALNKQEAIEEASMVLSYVKGYKITYPIAFDWEGYNISSYRVYSGKNSFTSETLTDISCAFCNLIRSSGYQAMHYGNKDSFYNWSWNTSRLVGKYKIWLAHYTSNAPEEKSNYTGTYHMWQYTSKGVVDGISGNVDLNIAYFAYGNSQDIGDNITITVPDKFTTNVNKSIDIFNGVTATNSKGEDISSSIELTIKNSSGTESTRSTAFNSPGIYNLEYKISVYNGYSKSANSKLIVRSKPVLAGISTSYTADTNNTYSKILEILKSGVSAKDYEGNNITSSINISISGISESNITAGTYIVTYNVTDSKNLSATPIKSTLIITEPIPTLTPIEE